MPVLGFGMMITLNARQESFNRIFFRCYGILSLDGFVPIVDHGPKQGKEGQAAALSLLVDHLTPLFDQDVHLVKAVP